MERFPKSAQEAEKLIQLADLLKDAAQTVIEEWKKEDFTKASSSDNLFTKDTATVLPGWELHQAERTILAATGAITELVVEPYARVQEVACQFFESRALFIASERRIADLLDEAGPNGLTVTELSERTTIEKGKLGKAHHGAGLLRMTNRADSVFSEFRSSDMRCLCSVHIFREIEDERFGNNRISAALVKNEPLRAYVITFDLDTYTASDHLPKSLLGDKGASYDVCETAFQQAVETTKPRWDWLAERVTGQELFSGSGGYPGVPDISNWDLTLDKKGCVTRPELTNFGRAMVGGGKLYGAAQTFDYPWGSLRKDTVVVDVGGGVGGFALQLLPVYPNLKYVVQDLPALVEQGRKEIWPREAPKALAEGRVALMPHNFFKPNPIKEADIYWLRGVIHDWSDDYCVSILEAIKGSMGPNSRILICDLVMNTVCGQDGMRPAPAPLPSTYGYFGRYGHHRDLCMMSLINGIERTQAEFQSIVERAGLRIVKIWECRSLNDIVEVSL